jgi:hypothetical protein
MTQCCNTIFTPEEIREFKLDAMTQPAREIAELVYAAAMAVYKVKTSKKPVRICTGGCTPFYDPETWEERGEEYGLESELIVCHDGGEFAPLCNLDYGAYDLSERFEKELEKRGLWHEPAMSWYTAVYKKVTA